MAFTFLKAQGRSVGRSLVEEDLVETARGILAQAKAKNRQVVLPVDCLVALDAKNPGRPVITDIAEIPSDMGGFDIGPRTAKEFSLQLQKAGTIFWNGPMGVFETPPFDSGTKVVAHAVADATQAGAVSVIGGGDSVAAVHQMGVADRISHISTGGGASLEFLEGKTLPGVAALNDR